MVCVAHVECSSPRAPLHSAARKIQRGHIHCRYVPRRGRRLTDAGGRKTEVHHRDLPLSLLSAHTDTRCCKHHEVGERHAGVAVHPLLVGGADRRSCAASPKRPGHYGRVRIRLRASAACRERVDALLRTGAASRSHSLTRFDRRPSSCAPRPAAMRSCCPRAPAKPWKLISKVRQLTRSRTNRHGCYI